MHFVPLPMVLSTTIEALCDCKILSVDTIPKPNPLRLVVN